MLSHQVQPGHTEVLGCRGTLLLVLLFTHTTVTSVFRACWEKCFNLNKDCVLTSISPALCPWSLWIWKLLHLIYPLPSFFLFCQELHVLSAAGERRREQTQCVLHWQQQCRRVGAGGRSTQGLPWAETSSRRTQTYARSLLPHSPHGYCLTYIVFYYSTHFVNFNVTYTINVFFPASAPWVVSITFVYNSQLLQGIAS